MNRKRIRILADYIEKHPEHFDMSAWASTRGGDRIACYVRDLAHMPCDSVGCIAGTAVGLFGDRDSKDTISMEARRVLGLSFEDSCALFYGDWAGVGGDLQKITAASAASHLRKLAESPNV